MEWGVRSRVLRLGKSSAEWNCLMFGSQASPKRAGRFRDGLIRTFDFSHSGCYLADDDGVAGPESWRPARHPDLAGAGRPAPAPVALTFATINRQDPPAENV
jgi:hypothetical protein